MCRRSLEEIDELFSYGKSKTFSASGVGAQINAIEEVIYRQDGAADFKLGMSSFYEPIPVLIL